MFQLSTIYNLLAIMVRGMVFAAAFLIIMCLLFKSLVNMVVSVVLFAITFYVMTWLEGLAIRAEKEEIKSKDLTKQEG